MTALVPTKAEIPRTSPPPALTDLPPANSPDLYISPASTALEYTHTWHLNADEWKGPLTHEQYFLREQKLLNLDLTRGTITAWILTSDKLPRTPEGARPILASCETLLKNGYVAQNKCVRNVRAHGIASVFNRKEYRGRGYASRMIAELAKKLDTYQQSSDTKGSFSVLYSDIGKNFYARHGWKAYPSTHVHLSPLQKQAYASLLQTSNLHHVVLETFSADDVATLSTSLTSSLKSTLASLTSTSPTATFAAIAPDSAHFAWHFAREDIQASLIKVPQGIPSVRGAIHEPTGTALTWARVYASKPEEWQLLVLYVILPNVGNDEEDVKEALAALLARAQLEAGEWDMVAGVEVWNPPEILVRAAQTLCGEEGEEVQVVERDREHICSLRLNGEGMQENVVWVANEKYAWC